MSADEGVQSGGAEDVTMMMTCAVEPPGVHVYVRVHVGVCVCR